jgi:FtsH-binding integral membrane protein
MYELMLIAAAVVALGGAFIAYDGSRDVFHPLIFIGPMLAFLYGWMPWKLLKSGGLFKFFDGEQLMFVQNLYLLGVLAFVVMCLSVGVRLKEQKAEVARLSKRVCQKLLICAVVVGGLGLTCWGITIHNVGGFVNAFSTSYAGGYDASGYVRDGSLLL